MPRKARQKTCESIYHVMCRSVYEFLLFREDEDKDYYMNLLKRYMDKYHCKIYAYCLMDNHLHLHLDPYGFDISKFMHCLNAAYAWYYNKKYKRYGPVFQERFESRILDTDSYNLKVSAYIHNNPKDIESFNGREQLYKYSSYGIYLGIRKDSLELVDLSFMKGLFHAVGEQAFIPYYKEFVTQQRDLGYSDVKKELACALENEYRQGRRIFFRDQSPVKIISYLSDKLLMQGEKSFLLKCKKRMMDFRALCAYSLRVLCGLGYREICENLYNITIYAKIFQDLAAHPII